MTWQDGLQLFQSTFTTGLAGLGVWFLYELIKEHKKLKEQSDKHLAAHDHDRKEFDLGIRSSLLKIEELKGDFDLFMKADAHEHRMLKDLLKQVTDQLTATREYVGQFYMIAKSHGERLDSQDTRIKFTEDYLKRAARK